MHRNNLEKLLIGYCRCSTSHQQISRQVNNILRCYPNAKIYKEFFTGTKLDRPVWNSIMKLIEASKDPSSIVLIFDEVSRLSRNADEGFEIYKELYEKGVTLVFLKEPHINTDSYKAALNIALPSVAAGDTVTQELIDGILASVKNFMLAKVKQDIYAAFERAQKEVDLLHQRTKEGLAIAKAEGKRVGTPKGSTLTTKKSIKSKELIKKHSITFGGSLSDADCIKLIGISRKTYYKYKKEMLNE